VPRLARVIQINRSRAGLPFNDVIHSSRRSAMNVTRYAFSPVLLGLAAGGDPTTRPAAGQADETTPTFRGV
jgi:hypothetical protein